MLSRVESVHDSRAPGATFALGDIGWIDFETISRVSIKAGSDRYSRHAHAVLLAWAIGDNAVHTETVADFGHTLCWPDMPDELHDFYARVERGEALFCAHNAGFDRTIWNNTTRGFPYMSPHMIIDSAVQASVSGLPRQLDKAAKYAGCGSLKDDAGKALINLFTLPKSEATPQSHPNEWQAFINYAARDVAAMRDLFRFTRQLPLAEWQEYWASEIVNDTGVSIDLDMVQAAASMAAQDQVRIGDELLALTEGAIFSVNQVKRILEWLETVLPSDDRKILIERLEEKDEITGKVTKPGKWALTRDRVQRMIAYLQSKESPTAGQQTALRVLQIRLYGGSKTPAKFSRMLTQHVDGVIRSQYVFGGASQTGRFSAKGIQVHNLARDTLDYEIDAIDSLTGGVSPNDFAVLGDDTPISRKLSLLIRPSLVAPKGAALVWSDWANIEARITPWLADDDEAEQRLDIFRAVDADPRIPDIYTRTAADISNLPIKEVTKSIRQRGKVVDLACGFGGGTNALLNMAAGYGMHLSETDAKSAVGRWREANPWASRFWNGLWNAATDALDIPGKDFTAGRIRYVFLPQYLGGSLMCELPSGRWLTYRRIKWERVDEVDEDTGEITASRMELMFSRDLNRLKLWPGLLAENVTQAAAADLLRGTLVRLAEPKFDWMPVVLHTHDEIVVEVDEADVDAATAALVAEMERGFGWTAGLPIKADATVGRWYSKNEGSWGL